MRDECWVDDVGSTLMAGGYRCVCIGSVTQLVHRLVYEILVGPIPVGWWIDHLCRNKECYNPSHLEAVTPGENTRRGWAFRRKTHCKRGHSLADAYVRPNGTRNCRTCNNTRRSRA